jgi:hypothetical protein
MHELGVCKVFICCKITFFVFKKWLTGPQNFETKGMFAGCFNTVEPLTRDTAGEFKFCPL